LGYFLPREGGAWRGLCPLRIIFFPVFDHKMMPFGAFKGFIAIVTVSGSVSEIFNVK